MWKSIVLGLGMVGGCVNSSATSQQQQSQNVAKQDDGTGQGHEEGGRHLGSTQIQLASGGTFELGVKVLDPDPIYMIIGGIRGETTSGGQSKDIEIRAIASGPSAGTTIGTGVAAVAGVLTNSVTPGYASEGPEENVALNFTKIELQYQNQDPETGKQIVAAGNAIAILAGGPDAANAVNVLTPAFGLPSSCGFPGGDSCDRLQITYDVATGGKLGNRVAIVIHDRTTNSPVEGAVVTACFGQGSQTVVTDANGTAVTGAFVGAQVSGVGVVASIGGQQLQCQRGATCDVTVPVK
jgi:hypothetical protein